MSIMLISYRNDGCALLSIDTNLENEGNIMEPSAPPKYLVDFLRKVDYFKNYVKNHDKEKFLKAYELKTLYEKACKAYLDKWPEFEKLI